MEQYRLRFQLKSDATFGRGDGVPGVVDQEVEHDEYGLPFLRGRTLKGLLVEECTNILYALSRINPDLANQYEKVADQMFGDAGSRLERVTALRVGDARLPNALRESVQQAVTNGSLTAPEVLRSLTDVRRQTAMDETGKPEPHSLRASRVILRETVFVAPLELEFAAGASTEEQKRAKALLAACVKAFHRAGVNRNRGAGRLTATLQDAQGVDKTESLFADFKTEVMPV